jgi:hypothetical protein
MKTVAELIEQLKAFPPELRVVTRGYEGGECDCDDPALCTIVLDVNDAWYYGPHEDVGTSNEHPGKPRVKAVRL